MVFNTLVGRAIIGKEIARSQGIEDPSEQLRLGLIGGLVGSSTLGLVATAAIAKQQAEKPPTDGEKPPVEQVKVPEVEGVDSFEAAQKKLAAVSLKAKEVGVYADAPKGAVVGQNPEAGLFVRRDSTVEVRVSRGAAEPAPPDQPKGKMPLVQGLSLEAAKAAIVQTGDIAEQDISVVYGFAYNGAKPQEVIMQNPDPGSNIDAETRPTLMVLGAVKVPSLRGLPLEQAVIVLASNRLVPTVEGSLLSGVVESQSPGEGEEVATFSSVKLKVKMTVEKKG